ncbi:MAG: hypothetical protein DWQ34_00165 [Planctomycetota bacterium]|nr:MAG: hypothetical protein DWQ34_00165 [Planctomycetota bacterium]
MRTRKKETVWMRSEAMSVSRMDGIPAWTRGVQTASDIVTTMRANCRESRDGNHNLRMICLRCDMSGSPAHVDCCEFLHCLRIALMKPVGRGNQNT